MPTVLVTGPTVAHVSFVHKISYLFNISPEKVYRTKILDIDELK